MRCTFTLVPGLKTLKGVAVESHPPFVFDTGGPAVIETRPWMGSTGVDEQQAFILVLDAEPVEQTVLDHAEFAVHGMAQRVGARIMGGADRDLLLKRFDDFINHRPAIILQARQAFPDNADVKLIWGKGIATISGIATSQAQEINFKVRPEFEAQFRCERENAQAACIPVTPMSLTFSAPISAENVKRIAIVGPDGMRRTAQLPDSTDLSDIRNLTFSGPFNESTQYTIEIPAGLTDDTGRPLSNAARFPLAVKTDLFPPLAKFSARFGIIEEADPVLPVTVRNLEPMLRGAQLKTSGMPSPTGVLLSDFLRRIDARVFGLSTPEAPTVISWLRRVASAQRRARSSRTTRATARRILHDCPGQTAPRRSRFSASRWASPDSISWNSKARAWVACCWARTPRCTFRPPRWSPTSRSTSSKAPPIRWSG